MVELSKSEIAEALIRAIDFLASIRFKCREYCECVCKLEKYRDYYRRKWEEEFENRGFKLGGYVFGYAPCPCWIAAYTVSLFSYGRYDIAKIERDFVYNSGEAYMRVDIKEIYDEDVKRAVCAVKPEMSACKS